MAGCGVARKFCGHYGQLQRHPDFREVPRRMQVRETCGVVEPASSGADDASNASLASALAIVRGAPIERVALDEGSWVDVATGFVRAPEAELDYIESVADWRQREVLRYDHYIGERRMSSGLRAPDHALLRQTGMHLRSRYHHDFAGVAAIRYADGDDFQGLHSDREMKWLDDTLVAIVVLGERRPFVLRPRARSVGASTNDDANEHADFDDSPYTRIASGRDPRDVVLLPGHGDLLVMGGRCQRDWLHGVPKATAKNVRISLTWRWTSRQGKPDTNPTYYDGRHYSDGPRQPGSRTRRRS